MEIAGPVTAAALAAADRPRSQRHPARPAAAGGGRPGPARRLHAPGRRRIGILRPCPAGSDPPLHARPLAPRDRARHGPRLHALSSCAGSNCTSDTRVHGKAGLREVLRQLQGFELPASAWEREVLPLRIGKLPADVAGRALPSRGVRLGATHPEARHGERQRDRSLPARTPVTIATAGGLRRLARSRAPPRRSPPPPRAAPPRSCSRCCTSAARSSPRS